LGWHPVAVVQYAFTHKQYTEQHNHLIGKSKGRAPSLRVVYPGICLTTEEKARKNLSQGSWRMPVGTMKTIYRTEHT